MQRTKHTYPISSIPPFPAHTLNKYKQNKAGERALRRVLQPVYLSQDGTPVLGTELLGQQQQRLLTGGLGHGLGVGCGDRHTVFRTEIFVFCTGR